LTSRFPLELISPKNHDSMNSTFGNRPDVDAQTAVAFIHPDDAARRGIHSGDCVRLFNDRGNCDLPAIVIANVRPGVVSVPSVRWGSNVNALTSERLTDIGGGATFYSCLVELEKVQKESLES
jgi:anaerobic selenocysteine-containing dehydrogenase